MTSGRSSRRRIVLRSGIFRQIDRQVRHRLPPVHTRQTYPAYAGAALVLRECIFTKLPFCLPPDLHWLPCFFVPFLLASACSELACAFKARPTVAVLQRFEEGQTRACPFPATNDTPLATLPRTSLRYRPNWLSHHSNITSFSTSAGWPRANPRIIYHTKLVLLKFGTVI